MVFAKCNLVVTQITVTWVHNEKKKRKKETGRTPCLEYAFSRSFFFHLIYEVWIKLHYILRRRIVYVHEWVPLMFVSIGVSKIGLYLTSGLRGLVNFLTFKSVAHSNLMQFLWGYIAKVLIFVLKSKNTQKLNLIWFKESSTNGNSKSSHIRYLVKFTTYPMPYSGIRLYLDI